MRDKYSYSLIAREIYHPECTAEARWVCLAVGACQVGLLGQVAEGLSTKDDKGWN